jgi:hypothetical protein
VPVNARRVYTTLYVLSVVIKILDLVTAYINMVFSGKYIHTMECVILT